MQVMQEEIKKQKKFLDLSSSNQQQGVADFRLAMKNSKNIPVLFSKGRRTESFFTEDSKLYITPREQLFLKKGLKLDRKTLKWDGLSARVVTKFVRYQPSETSILLKSLEKRYAAFDEATIEMAQSFSKQFSVVRLWNASIIGSILFGMVMMTFVYRYLGQGALAKQPVIDVAAAQQVSAPGMVLGAADTKDDAESFAKQVKELEQVSDRKALEREIVAMVKGYPIEKMAPAIAKQDRTVAAYIVAIAKKESAWGKRIPVLKGQDCNNYWGYRGKRELMGSGGHTCFNSPEDGVNTVAKRIKTLVEKQGVDSPKEMVNIWKCGGDCEATGGQAAADKWAVDVESIFKKFGTND